MMSYEKEERTRCMKPAAFAVDPDFRCADFGTVAFGVVGSSRDERTLFFLVARNELSTERRLLSRSLRRGRVASVWAGTTNTAGVTVVASQRYLDTSARRVRGGFGNCRCPDTAHFFQGRTSRADKLGISSNIGRPGCAYVS